jgi:hypothetical protein
MVYLTTGASLTALTVASTNKSNKSLALIGYLTTAARLTALAAAGTAAVGHEH